jgi:shikimate dehydrogenase
MHMIRLGLIGDNIRESRAPKLHRLCGMMCGLDVSYDLLIPAEQVLAFDELFERCRSQGYRGLNITLPYKIRVFPKLRIDNPLLRLVGSANTVVFDGPKPSGHNTDFTGFMAAYRARFGYRAPGLVAMAGAGGAGRAVAFGLLELGAEELRIFDSSHEMAESLCRDLMQAGKGGFLAQACGTIEEALDGARGIVNCTPLGMHGYQGTAFPCQLLAGKSWAFDAVYTPMVTTFIEDAEAQGLDILGGYELHFYQGIQAFTHFTGLVPPDLARLRSMHLDESVKV